MSTTNLPHTEKDSFQNIPLQDFPPQYESAVNAELRRFDDAEAHQTKPDLPDRPKQSRRRRYLIIGCAVFGVLAVLAIMAGVVATYLSGHRRVSAPTPSQNSSSIAETISQTSTLSVRSFMATTTATAFATITVTAAPSLATGMAPIRATEISSTTVTSTFKGPASGILTVAATVHTTVESTIISYLTESDTSFFRPLPSTSTLSYASTATVMVTVPNITPTSSPSPPPSSSASSSTYKTTQPVKSVAEKTWLNSLSFTTVYTATTPPPMSLVAAARPTSTKKGGLINFCGVPGEACSD